MSAAPTNMSYGIIRNIVWNFVGQGFLLVFSFLATPFIIRRLNVDLYGIYVLTGVMIGYFAFLDLGFGAATVKYISQYLAKGEKELICEVFWSCFVVYFFMGLLGTAMIFFSSGILVHHFFKIPEGLKPLAILALRVGSFTFLISMMMGVISSVIRAVGRFDVLNKTSMALGALQIVVTVLLLVLKYSLIAIIIANIIIQILGMVWYGSWARRLLPYLTKRPAAHRKVFVKLFKFGGFVTISSIVAPVLVHLEKLLLTALRPVGYLTYYSVPFSLVDRLSLIRSSFSSALFPAFSSLQETDKVHLNKEIHYRSTLYIFFLYFFFVVFFIVFGYDFLNLWLGRVFADESTRILKILVLAGLVNALAAPSMSALQGMEKPHLPALYHVIETVFYIPTCYFLILKWGGVGAAIAWFLRVSLDTLLLHWGSCLLFKEHLISWYGKILFSSLLPAGSCIFLFLALKNLRLNLIHPLSLAGIFFILLVYAGIVWKTGLDDFARKQMRGFLRSASPWRA